ncbi:MAG TPA: histidine kinase [Chryseolinea sp.]|nr:histidine kinase [Chryseolinea sp.]
MANFSPDLIYTAKNLVVLMAYSYIVSYWLLPCYLIKRRYLAFVSWLVVLTLIAEIIRLYYSGFLSLEFVLIWFGVTSFVSVGAPIYCGLFITTKMIKTWYAKEAEKLILIRENANAELQLLKAQMHPHFLFNTLNNIYSFALDKSPKAPELVLKLSAVIKYMINDCDASLVSVEKEIRMIKDYIGLEKVRYGNHLDLHVQIANDQRNKLIAPFLLIPFIENSFKHGASQILKHPWIKITLIVNSDHLYFELSNSKPNEIPELNAKKGIGLRNVEKRLQLLYPESHQLTIMNEETRFAVVLKVPLKDVRQDAAVRESTHVQDAIPTFS